MRPLHRAERMFLVGIVGTAAVLGGASLVATSCLDRRNSTDGEGATSVTHTTSAELGTPKASTVNDSTGGTKQLSSTSNEDKDIDIPGGTTATATSSEPPVDRPPTGHSDHASFDPERRSTPAEAPPAMPAPATSAPPPPVPAPSSPPEATDAAAQTSSNTGSVDAGAAPLASASQGPTFSAGAGRFLTEPPPDRASAWVSDPNAGAGPFTTDRSSPPEPIWYGVPSGSAAPPK